MDLAPSGGEHTWRRFAVVAGIFAGLAIAFTISIVFRLGGDTVTVAVDDIGEGVAAGIAAVCCGLAARRSAGRLRVAWVLLGTSAGSWCLGEALWSLYEVGFGNALPYPSAADIGFVAAIPLSVAGILAFSHTPRGTSTGLRLWLEGSIVALALLFVAWELGLSQVYAEAEDQFGERLLDLTYPVGDIVIGTVLVLAIRRATDEQQGRLFLILGGLAALSISDSAFAYLTATGNYGSIGSDLDAGWVIGYLMIASAAFWPAGSRDRPAEEKPIDTWQLVLPWIAILAAGLTAVLAALEGHPFDTFLTVLAGVLAALLMVSQVLAHRESLRLLIESRRSAATLNEVIVRAPLGMARIARQMTVIQANPALAAQLEVPVERLLGAGLDAHFSSDELRSVVANLQGIAGSDRAVNFDSRASRADGTEIWLHLTATAVMSSSGPLDYYLVMFEDVSARRKAELAEAANVAALKKLNQLKSELLTRVRHQFRTALVGIQGFSEFIGSAEELELEDAKGFAKDIYDDARRLDQTFEEVLELDRAESTGSRRDGT
jgi:PAS domain S-box-containing protein